MVSELRHPNLRLGTAPDSWGVWLPEDSRQIPWDRFLDEVAQCGYKWVELGPYGYLPTDPNRLEHELGSRGLRLSGGTVSTGLHRGADALEEALVHTREIAQLTTALGARHLVILPEMWSDLDGTVIAPTELTSGQWEDLNSGMSVLGRAMSEEFDTILAFHPHADSHVDTQDNVVRFLEGTDPAFVQLCLDTGHIAYCGGDCLKLIQYFAGRIAYAHLKQVDPVIRQQCDEEGIGFASACMLGVMAEPPHGVPAMEPILDALTKLDVPLFTVVEQDMFPCEFDKPAPIARRTRRYFNACGLGPVRP